MILGLMTLAVMGCTSDDEEADRVDEWWAPLMSYIPADQAAQELYVADYSDQRDRLGTRGAATTAECFERIENAGFDDSVNAVPMLEPIVGLHFAASFGGREPPPTESLIGFNACQIVRMAIAGTDPDSVAVLVLDTETSAIVDLLQRRGYSETTHAAGSYYATGADDEIVDRATGAYLNRVFVDQSILVHAPTDALIEASLSAHADQRSRDSDAVTILRALGDFHAAHFLAADFDATQIDIVTAGGGFVPDEQVEAKRRAIIEQYQTWGRIPRPERVAFAYNRVDDAHQMKIALLYGDRRSDAEAAADELETRLTEYLRSLTRQPLCTEPPGRPAIEEVNGMLAVIATCVTERGSTWLDVVFTQDMLFLVEDLPEP